MAYISPKPPPERTKWKSPKPEIDTELIKQYDHIANALSLGLKDEISKRPALPIELVRDILRIAEWKYEDLLCINQSQPRKFHIHTWLYLKRSLFFFTEPLPESISHIWGVQLHTFSGNQGWVDDPNYVCTTWFEVAIYTPVVGSVEESTPEDISFPALMIGKQLHQIKQKSTKEALTWHSHANTEYRNEMLTYEGIVFGPDHQIWSHVSPEDRLVVLGCCQEQNWECKGEDGYLKVWQYYDPTSALHTAKA